MRIDERRTSARRRAVARSVGLQQEPQQLDHGGCRGGKGAHRIRHHGRRVKGVHSSLTADNVVDELAARRDVQKREHRTVGDGDEIARVERIWRWRLRVGRARHVGHVRLARAERAEVAEKRAAVHARHPADAVASGNQLGPVAVDASCCDVAAVSSGRTWRGGARRRRGGGRLTLGRWRGRRRWRWGEGGGRWAGFARCRQRG